MQRECREEIRRFLTTGDYDRLHAVWPGRHVLERMNAGDAALRAALADALRQRINGLTFPSLSTGFDAGQFALGKVRSMDYFKDGDPFADWAVHEAAHVFHNWKLDFVGLPETRIREFLLNIAVRPAWSRSKEAYPMGMTIH